MGYYADRMKGRGQLYLVTRDEEPFCAHQYLIKVESSKTDVPIISYGRIQVTLIGDTLLNETFTLTKKEDEEMRLGESISKIIVPHPILLPPSHIQITYTSYAGWLTSGLLQWKVDKISLSDSYGKSVSICRKNLILESGVPVILPLFPGDCNVPSKEQENYSYAEERFDDKERSKFVPNIVEENKNVSASDEIAKEWNEKEKENSVDNEESRAFNTRHVKSAVLNENATEAREVVEPILKPQSTKNARSHNLDKDKEKPEITEPILGPTTTKFVATTFKEEKLFDEKGDDWVPSVNLKRRNEKWKREDESSVSINHTPKPSPPPPRRENGFDVIVRTVQFLPQRIARMFEDAEKYARETILPFVSTYTPRFISDFINPRESQRQRYVPLHFEEPTTTRKPKKARKNKNRTAATTQKITTQDEESNSIVPIEKTERMTLELTTSGKEKVIKTTTTTTSTPVSNKQTTPYSHIQKIQKKGEKVAIVYPENSPQLWSAIDANNKEKNEETTTPSSSQRSISNAAKRSVPKEIYIDLPVFEEDYKSIKYIPITEKVR